MVFQFPHEFSIPIFQFPELCPLSNKCITESVVYQATVTIKDKTTNRPPQTYVGLTENSFKTRLANHKASFNSFDKRNATELSKYVWELKNQNINYTIKWKLLKRAKPYNCASNRCNLCLWEKYFIICKPKMATLNKRNVWNARTVLSGNLSLHLVTLMLSGVHFTLYAVHSLLHVVLYSLHAVHP